MRMWRRENFERYFHHLHSAWVPCGRGVWWTIYIGVKRFRYGGSVVSAMPSASAIRVSIRNETHGGCSTGVPSRAVRLHDHVSREF